MPVAAWVTLPGAGATAEPTPLPPTRLMERIMKHAEADLQAGLAAGAAAQAAAAAQALSVSLLRGGFEAQHSKFAHGVGTKAEQVLAEGTGVDDRALDDAASDLAAPFSLAPLPAATPAASSAVVFTPLPPPPPFLQDDEATTAVEDPAFNWIDQLVRLPLREHRVCTVGRLS